MKADDDHRLKTLIQETNYRFTSCSVCTIPRSTTADAGERSVVRSRSGGRLPKMSMDLGAGAALMQQNLISASSARKKSPIHDYIASRDSVCSSSSIAGW